MGEADRLEMVHDRMVHDRLREAANITIIPIEVTSIDKMIDNRDYRVFNTNICTRDMGTTVPSPLPSPLCSTYLAIVWYGIVI